MDYLIGVTPVPAQFDWSVLVGIGGILAVLLAIAIALHVVTAPPSASDVTAPGPSAKRLGRIG